MQQQIQQQLAKNGKLKTSDGYNQTIMSRCNSCFINTKKSQGPKVEFEGVIWPKLVEKNGKIVMQNGHEYEFKQFFQNGKTYYKFVETNVITESLSKDYENFDMMVEQLELKCKKHYCN